MIDFYVTTLLRQREIFYSRKPLAMKSIPKMNYPNQIYSAL